MPVAASKMFLHALYSSLLNGLKASGAGRGHEGGAEQQAFSHPSTGQVGAQEPTEGRARAGARAPGREEPGAGAGGGGRGWGRGGAGAGGGGGGRGSGSCQKASGFWGGV